MKEEFSFGTLATDDLRLKQLRAQRRGVSHLNRIEPRDPVPGVPIRLKVETGVDVAPASVICRYSIENGVDSGSVHETRFERLGSEWDTLTWGYITSWQAEIPPQAAGTMVRYTVEAILAEEGNRISADDGATFAFLVDDDPPPSWAKDAIIYQVFLDRFFPGSDRAWREVGSPADIYGGTLQGVTEKLGYLQELGINCLWLSPCFESPSHHGYDVTDLFKIEPRLGTNQALGDLVAEAHARGIRVLLDFVPNHISHKHPAFHSAQTDPDSQYRNWFLWQEWPNEYETFFGVNELPKLNLSDPSVRQHVIDAAVFWIEEYGVDGYRLDYAYGPTHDFWVDFRRAVRRANESALLLGEIVETAELQRSFEGRLDGTLDFLLMQALRGVFAFGSWDFERFDAFLSDHEQYFGRGFVLPTFLDNHDMNRFLWATTGDKAALRLAALCQFTLPGPPIIYYGTEVGLSQDREIWREGKGLLEESRLPMLWNGQQDDHLRQFYAKLIRVRRQNPILVDGGRRTLYVDPKTYVYERSLGDERLVIALNMDDRPRAIRLAECPALDVIHNRRCVERGGKTEITLGPRDGALLAPETTNLLDRLELESAT